MRAKGLELAITSALRVRFPSRRVKGCYVAANYKKGVLLYSSVLSRFGTCRHSILVPASLRLSLLPARMKYLINSLRGHPRSELAADVINRQRNFTLCLLFTHPSLCSWHSFLPVFLSLFFTVFLTHFWCVLQLFCAVSRSRKSLSAKFRGLTNSPISRNENLLSF